VKIQHTKTHKKKERLTNDVAYHSSEFFALRDGNIVYNHPLLLKEHRPICSKLRNHFLAKIKVSNLMIGKKSINRKMEGLSVHLISSIVIEIDFKRKIPVSHNGTKGFSTLCPSFRPKILDGIKK